MYGTSLNQRFVGFPGVILLALLAQVGASAQTPPPNVQFLHAFTGGSAGADPVTPVIQTPDGSLVGVTYGAGIFASSGGVLYKISPTGQFTVLHAFPADGSEGGVYRYYYPASIMQASDQNFYGTFPSYGQGNAGTLYRVTPTGVYHQIHDFDGDGFEPFGPLAEGFDGYLYGVSSAGPGNSPGAIFRVGLDGSFAYVYLFDPAAVSYPLGGLALGQDGNFYGLAQQTLYKFDPVASTATGLGSAPNPNVVSNALPVLGPSNRAYFSDTSSGFCNCPGGAIVSLGLDGSGLEFNYLFTEPATAAAPSLTLAGNGVFYTAGGFGRVSYAAGVNLTNQHVQEFALEGIGNNLNGSLSQISNGSLAGTTYSGGITGSAGGTLFLLNVGAPKPAPAILGFMPQTASAGQMVTLWGNYFVGTSAIAIAGTPAQFKVSASGFVSFTVPPGGSSGLITVTNAAGSTTSADVLIVQ